MSETSTAAANTAAATTNTTVEAKSWPKEQNWIKDVLSKSGTELVQLTANKSIKITKKLVKPNENDSQNNTMVYYQSTPLIIKSEQPSQAQLCAPLRNSQQHHEPQLQHANTNNSYILNNVNITAMQQQQQQQQQHNQLQQHQQQLSHNNINSTSITTPNSQQQQFLTNIKTELLPPGTTLYATTPQPASLTTMPTPTSTTTPTNNVSSSTPTSTTPGVTGGGRKSNANKPQFKCEQCGMTFGSKSAHTSHTKSHNKNNDLLNGSNSPPLAGAGGMGVEVNEAGVPLGIPKTPQIKPNANAATNGGDPYQCNVCQKTFAVPARLIRHYRTHTGERPFECEFCHKLFSVKENLQVHRRIHTKERPYKCDVCGRAFEHSGKLHRHMRIHTGERPHKCSVCDKTFIQSGQLVIHMRTHTGEKPYKCPVEGCGKGFTCSKQLKVHSRTHTGEKPYHCDICFRDFGYNHVLKLHRVQHYGSKCYKCTICDETFKSKKEMEAHIKGHANEMPDDEEENNANGNATTSSAVSTSSGAETNSGPNSPQSPSSSIGTSSSTNTTNASTTAKPRKQRKEKLSSNSSSLGGPLSPASPGSPISSSMSPSSSYASGSRLSAASPTSSVASPNSLTLEADHHSRDSGVASGSIPCNNTRQLAAVSLVDLSHQAGFPISDEMPTDLSVSHQSQHQQHNEQNSNNIQQHQQNLTPLNYHHYQSSPSPQHHQQQQQHHQQQQYHYLNTSSSPSPNSDLLHQPQSIQHHLRYESHHQPQQPTINPALLEAATIASRREDDVQQAAIQIMQLHHSQQKSNKQQQQQLGNNSSSPIYNDLPPQHQLPIGGAAIATAPTHHNLHHKTLSNHHSDVMKSLVMNNLTENLIIDHYKRDELVRHVGGGVGVTGLAKGYAPVPKFESSLHDNEILLRQVEAAIAPLRSSTESPERSSSPENEMMLMADRDVMTLPLRKRKLYMSDCGETAEHEATNGAGAKELNPKVMRHSSVIQFAKAS